MQGIENSNNCCQKLYKTILTKNYTDDTNNKYKVYRNALNRIKQKAKCDYYNNKNLGIQKQPEEAMAINKHED